MERFERTERLIGKECINKLKKAHVAVFGIGGVGSYSAEAFARSGIGEMDIFDSDIIDITNINRQIIALSSTVGKNKVDVEKERILDINPAARVNAYKVFLNPEVINEINFCEYDYVVDAIDNVTAKVSICEAAAKNNIPVISAMGAGNRLDPTEFEIAPIEKTSGCPLARVMRTELRKRGITNVKAVFSRQPALKTSAFSENRRAVPASIAYVPSVMGLLIAKEVICDIINN